MIFGSTAILLLKFIAAQYDYSDYFTIFAN